jgi:hypothetical protein
MKKIVRGNDFTLRIPVCKIVNGEQVAFPLPACTDIVVNIVNQYRRVALSYTIDTAEDNIINARVEGDAVSVGTYALEVRGKIFGNDWRSKEYEQFCIVDNNASGDTAFNGELIEGEDSVEMNTALVILPPTAELTQLITDANTAIETAKQTDATLKANESERTEAEQQRVSAETARVSAENKRSESEEVRHAAEAERVSNEEARKTAEAQRANAETERAEAEKTRTANETARVAAEKQRATTFTELSANVDAAVSKANSAASAANSATDKANAEEGKRAEAEEQRAEAEDTRKQNENTRLEAETERVRQEAARETAEATRQNAEVEREKSDAEREKRVLEAISNTSSAAKAATDAAAVATEAGNNAESKATEAERVNAELNGNMLVVTDRNGDVRTLDFEQWDLEERVNITITTSVAGVSVKGVAVNVFLNGSSAFTKYTTDADGKVSFTIPRGAMYRIAFQELKGCDPLPSLTYTAALRVRDINVEYKPISDEQASVIVTIDKAENGSVSPFGGVAVTCAIANGDTITTETDSEGKVTFRVPYNKKYKITAAQKDGCYAFRGVYEKNNVADVAEHNLYFHYYPTTSGVFILDATGAQYTADEWQAAGKTAEEAVLIKLVTQNLANGNNCFGFSPAALQNGYPSKQWCTQTVLFNNIPANGKDTNDALYYDGYKSSKLIREEAQERNLTVPAFSFAYDCTVEMAGETLHGYMVSFGQAAEMFINKAIVDDVIKVLYGSNAQQLSSLFSRNLWTSTQGDVANAWFLSDKLNNKSTKPHDFCVIPVFAC